MTSVASKHKRPKVVHAVFTLPMQGDERTWKMSEPARVAFANAKATVASGVTLRNERVREHGSWNSPDARVEVSVDLHLTRRLTTTRARHLLKALAGQLALTFDRPIPLSATGRLTLQLRVPKPTLNVHP